VLDGGEWAVDGVGAGDFGKDVGGNAPGRSKKMGFHSLRQSILQVLKWLLLAFAKDMNLTSVSIKSFWLDQVHAALTVVILAAFHLR